MKRLLLLALFCALPLAAQDEKSEMIHQMGVDSFLGMRYGVLLDKLCDYKLTPAWWARFTNERDARNSMSNLGNTMGVVANNLGWGDLDTLDNTRDSKSPLFLEAIDSWKPKMHWTLVMDKDYDEKGTALALSKFDTMLTPIGWAKPRSGQYNLTIRFDAKAKNFSYTTDKAHVNYTLVMPVYADVVQSTMQEAVQRGN